MSNLQTLSETLKQSDNTFGFNTLEKFVKDLATEFLQSKSTDIDDDMQEKCYQLHVSDSDGSYIDTIEFSFENTSGIMDMCMEVTCVISSEHINGEGGSDNTRDVNINDYEITGIKFMFLDNEFYLNPVDFSDTLSNSYL